jgi:hypothetical protein
MSKRLAVLGFHKIGEPSPGNWRTWYYVPEPVFAKQLAALDGDRWKVIDIAGFLKSLDEPGTLPDRAALLTFDDGYKSVLDSALPVLEQVDQTNSMMESNRKRGSAVGRSCANWKTGVSRFSRMACPTDPFRP